MMLKSPPLRDRKYLDRLRGERCVITGLYADESDPVEAMHIGTAGKGLKSPDSEALPVKHSLHALAHQKGEITMFRIHAPDWLIREALRAYAREMYMRSPHRRKVEAQDS